MDVVFLLSHGPSTLDEGLGLEVDTSDEENEELLGDEHPDIESAEEDASINSENESDGPITPKSAIPPSLIPSRGPGSLGAEESVTGKPDRQHLPQPG
jgi:hypothetical protein